MTFAENRYPEVKPEYIENLDFATNNFKNAIINLNAFQVTVDNCCSRMNAFQQGLNKFMQSAKGLSELYLSKHFDTRQRDMFINPYWSLRDWVYSEILDTEAMIEAILKLTEYDSLLLKLQHRYEVEEKQSNDLRDGKKNFFTMLGIKSQESAIKEKANNIETVLKDIKAVNSIRNSLYYVLLDVDIFKFISSKTEVYKNYLKECCRNTIQEYEELVIQMQSIRARLDV